MIMSTLWVVIYDATLDVKPSNMPILLIVYLKQGVGKLLRVEVLKVVDALAHTNIS